eukprot:Partr_v1_DN28746_c0_g1_i1_m62773 putative Ceramidase
MNRFLFVVPFLAVFLGFAFANEYHVGIGIHDITGPAGGVNFMGYAMPQQITAGIHTRLFARAFIFVSGEKRVVYVSCDVGMLSPNIKNGIIARVQQETGSTELYTERNVMISATHTHSAPAGFHSYLLYSITSLGFIKESADDMIIGIANAILRAHSNIQPRRLSLVAGDLTDANINRSPLSYLANPEAERSQYPDGDTDKTMTLLSISEKDDPAKHVGLVNWFSVHGTSMNNTNYVISADNKGYAGYLMEHEFNSHLVKDGDVSYAPYLSEDYHKLANGGNLFVAAFGQTSEGDVSPNTDGAFCLNTGEPCDALTSTCKDDKGKESVALCHGRGPGFENGGGDKESTRIIGLRQYVKARSLLRDAENSTAIGGPIMYQHAWIDIAHTNLRLPSGEIVRTCPAARGYSFGAGTTDGPGAGSFVQGDNSTGNPFWNVIRKFIATPSAEQVKCHAPKPILLDTGEARFPYAWEPSIVDIQMFQLGSLFVLAVPAEFTTMSGRRLRAAIKEVLVNGGVWPEDGKIVISGLSNSYSAYVATEEEYQVQRYEGASTLFGPHTLAAYIQEFKRLAYGILEQHGKQAPKDLPESTHVPTIPPADFTKRLITFLPPVGPDATIGGRKFGQTTVNGDIKGSFKLGDTVQATFHAGHPRNVARDPTLQLEHSFLTVEKYIGPDLSFLDTIQPYVQSILLMPLDGAVKTPTSQFFALSLAQTAELRRQISEWKSRKESHDWRITSGFDAPGDLIKVSIWDALVSRTGEKTFDLYIDPWTLAVHQDSSAQPSKPSWKMVRDDGDWDTEFHWWKPVPVVSAISYAQLKWTITKRPDTMHDPSNDEKQLPIDGIYRLKYRGAHRGVGGKVTVHEGVSSMFQVCEKKCTQGLQTQA